MRRKTFLGIACWILAAYGALHVADLPIDSHELCGPWGCLPPVQALAAMHLLWCVLLFPVVMWMLTKLHWRLLRSLGLTLMTASALAMACLIGSDLPHWLMTMPPPLQGYWGRRILAVLAVQTDLPLLQVFVAGGVCWLKSRGWSKQNTVQTPFCDPPRLSQIESSAASEIFNPVLHGIAIRDAVQQDKHLQQ